MNHPKIEAVDMLGATVELGFAVCDGFVSDIYVYLSLVFCACYHWWICLLVWLLSLFKNYYYLFMLIIFFILIFFLSFFLPFLLSWVADRVLVLWPSVRPEPLRWETRAQDTEPPETSQPHVISIGESSPERSPSQS